MDRHLRGQGDRWKLPSAAPNQSSYNDTTSTVHPLLIHRVGSQGYCGTQECAFLDNRPILISCIFGM